MAVPGVAELMALWSWAEVRTSTRCLVPAGGVVLAAAAVRGALTGAAEALAASPSAVAEERMRAGTMSLVLGMTSFRGLGSSPPDPARGCGGEPENDLCGQELRTLATTVTKLEDEDGRSPGTMC